MAILEETTLSLIRGDDKSFLLTLKNQNHEAIDITDWTVYFTAKKKTTDIYDASLIAKTITVHQNPTEGITSIDLTSTETATLTPVNVWYDIKVKTKEQKMYTLMKGQIEIDDSITGDAT